MNAAWLPFVGETEDPDEPFLERAARWAVGVSYREIPKPVRRTAKMQLTSAIGAALWTRMHPLGERIERAIGAEKRRGNSTFFGGERLTPSGAVRGNAALSGALEFDGRLLGGATSPSCVFVPLAYAEATNASGRDLLVAQVAANEITARLGAATAVGSFAGPNAAWSHAAGAAVGRAILEGDDRETLADALAIALTAPSRPIKRSTLGSDAGVWMASDAIQTGISALDGARAGMAGSRDMIEAEDGLLASVSPHPAKAYLSALGSRWHTAAVSVSAVPGNVYVAAAAEAGLEARSQFDRGRTIIDRVDVYGPRAMVSVDDEAKSYLDEERDSIAARSRSVTDAVATGLVTGESPPRRLAERAERAAIERVEERIGVHHDPELTFAALRSTVPEGVDFETATGSVAVHVGKALGPAAAVRHAPTVIRMGSRLAEPPTVDDFERRIGARVVVRTADGRTVEATVDRPSGTAGAPLAEIRAVARSKCRNAFEALGCSEPAARDRTDRLLAIDERDEIRIDRLLGALDTG
ncbi:MAG: MmgE/PrpD family protein [Halobacteriota archaeon]|uniref:MmgE/PrpD family protein n=1 Tax=Natronomonas sp. TaxID=2184060 RepID=UPI003974ACF6